MASPQHPATDIALIGAGPIGLETAVELQRAGLDYLHFDKGQIASTIMWYPPGTTYFSSPERLGIAGIPLQTPNQAKATKEQYIAYLRSIAMAFNLNVRTYEQVTAIQRNGSGDGHPGGGPFTLTTRTNRGEHTYRANRVVLAIGDMAGPRMLGIPGEDLPHVSHYFQDPHTYYNRRVLIVGGKNSAVEAALRCYHAGAHVTISYRRAQFSERSVKYWLLPELHGRIRRGEVRAHFDTVPTAIGPHSVTLAPTAKSGRRARPFDVQADFVLLLTGYVADQTLLKMAGVELRGRGGAPVFDERTMQTNVPGVYIAGTASAGTQQRYTLFIENCHIHATRIARALTGAPPPPPPKPIGLPET